MGMLEARVRIQTTLRRPSSVHSCDGSFPYLIGKYVQDFGVVDESCYPYVGKDSPCDVPNGCLRHYASDYSYVGGFYGGCSESAMMLELVKHGPVGVAFEVYPDFMHYKEGIYHHTGLHDSYNPFELTNPAVLLVGYGHCHMTGQKFWVVKNSWGASSGSDGDLTRVCHREHRHGSQAHPQTLEEVVKFLFSQLEASLILWPQV